MTIRPRMSYIMGLIRPEHLELFALELKEFLYFTLFTCYHLQISTNRTKLGQNMYDHKISDEFNYGSNRTRTTGVICPLIKNNCYI